MDEPIIIKTEEKKYEDQIWAGVFGLILVGAAMGGMYLWISHGVAAVAAGVVAFVLTCFVKGLRDGYLAIVASIIGLIIVFGAIGLIVAGVLKFSGKS